ncbi:hypothetical protein Btru_072407 [Bulinus truncatus]|nr:hypothetical protein Btru_072407 [Bulinus truncatus]
MDHKENHPVAPIPKGYHTALERCALLLARRWFSADHFWVEIMEGVAKLGRTNYRVLNDSVDFVSLPKIGVPVKKNETVGFLKIVNTQPIICPLNGMIIEINQEIIKQPCLLLTSPLHEEHLFHTLPDLVNKGNNLQQI